MQAGCENIVRYLAYGYMWCLWENEMQKNQILSNIIQDVITVSKCTHAHEGYVAIIFIDKTFIAGQLKNNVVKRMRFDGVFENSISPIRILFHF